MTTVLALERWHTGSNAASIRTSVVYEERMTSGQRQGLMLYVVFSVLTLMAGWHQACEKPRSTNPQRRTRSELRDTGSYEKWPLNESSNSISSSSSNSSSK